ncbi:hypothetical protein RHMOL_Rhmol03G0090000 [Rhododendron molle]|uniref:Uncharacterized protein n=1 Tax=Rhododendron molle TaxID=49168 RepID=A0ACC0PCJ5_RHOML|nr:hypothetical protein RHMOL_Rhmol03G0090000 [Rhododendron molle]
MDLDSTLHAFVPSSTSVTMLLGFFAYLGIAGTVIPGKVVPGVILSDGTRLHYRCNGLLTLILLVALLSIGVRMSFISPTAIADNGLELLSATLIFSFVVTLILYVAGRRSHNQGSSLKPHVTGNLIDDWWFGIQLNPQFMGIDLKFFFVRAGMMGWLLINLSILAKSVKESNLSQSMILYQIFCVLYILDYFFYEEYMTSTISSKLKRRTGLIGWRGGVAVCKGQTTVIFMSLSWSCKNIIPIKPGNHLFSFRWDIIAEKLGFMLVFGDLVWIPFTFSIQGWWLLSNKVELTTAAVIANCIVFLIGYRVFRGANKQKHEFKKNPKAPIWGRPPKVIGGKLLASGYWGIARHCNYLGDLLLAASFSLTCGIISPIPYFYPIYLLILLIWRERRDEARCAEKYREVWAEYCKLVPWRILPYAY